MPAHQARRHAAARERGSVAMALIVIVVATIMVVALLVTTQVGLRSARRAGDSANALQLADAGINDAAKAITAHTSDFSGTSGLGTAGSYSYTATKDGSIWRLDATGTDATGVKRRVLADAVDQPLFGNAFFALAASDLKGTADSYTGPSNTCASTPGMGVVGSNGSITFTGGTGTSAYNCRHDTDPAWQYAADGCAFFGQSTIPLDAKGNDPIGRGACPREPDTATYPDKYVPPAVTVPAGVTSEGDFSCAPGEAIPSGTHLYSSITLRDGCRVSGAGAAVLFVTGPVTIGAKPDGECNNVINAPPAGACSSGQYQSGWPAMLQINVAGSGTVDFANHAVFWGVVNAPARVFNASGQGTPHVEVFGAVLANSASAAAQFEFHYDQSLRTQLTTGQYRVTNWREEPVG
jgi:Tfp pilus assembly protein PilX